MFGSLKEYAVNQEYNLAWVATRHFWPQNYNGLTYGYFGLCGMRKDPHQTASIKIDIMTQELVQLSGNRSQSVLIDENSIYPIVELDLNKTLFIPTGELPYTFDIEFN